MTGRLIVALLVIASAAFVMLQKRETESTHIQSNLADLKAQGSAERAAALEKQVALLQEQVSALEDKLSSQDAHLEELANDCTPTVPEPPAVEIASFKRRPAQGDLMGPLEAFRSGRVDQRFSVILRGAPATLTRLRVFSSLDDGTPLRGTSACDTMETDDVPALLGVFVGMKPLVNEFGPQAVEKKRGLMPLELRCDLPLDATQPVTLEVVFAGGGIARATLEPSEAGVAQHGNVNRDH